MDSKPPPLIRLRASTELLSAAAFGTEDAADAIKAVTNEIASRRLWYWKDVDVEMPPPMWQLPSAPVVVDAPPLDAEAAWTADGWPAGGRPPLLTAKQQDEVRESGRLTVPCEALPAHPHVWQLNRILVKGRVPTLESLRHNLGSCLAWVVMDVPELAARHKHLSVWAGIREIFTTLYDTVDLLVGVRSMKPSFAQATIDAEVWRCCNAWVLAHATPVPVDVAHVGAC